jgi:hypothetical protein
MVRPPSGPDTELGGVERAGVERAGVEGAGVEGAGVVVKGGESAVAGLVAWLVGPPAVLVAFDPHPTTAAVTRAVAASTAPRARRGRIRPTVDRR